MLLEVMTLQHVTINGHEVAHHTSGGQLDAYAALDCAGHAAIDRGNAEAIFPRFARNEITSSTD